MSYKFVGPVGKELRGNRTRAGQLIGSARLLAQRAIDKIEARGGTGQQLEQWRSADGCNVWAWVTKYLPGTPLVRVKIWCPEPEKKGLIIAIPFEIYDGAATHAFVAEFYDDGTFYRLVPLGYVAGTSLPTYEEDYPVCGPYYVVGSSPKDPMTMGTFSQAGSRLGEGGFRNRYDPTIEGFIYQSGKRIGELPTAVHGAVLAAGGLILIGDYHAGELTWYKKVEGEWEPQVTGLVVATDFDNDMVWSQAIQFYILPDGKAYGVGYIGPSAGLLEAAAEIVLLIDEEGEFSVVSTTLTATSREEVWTASEYYTETVPGVTVTSTGSASITTYYDVTGNWTYPDFSGEGFGTSWPLGTVVSNYYEFIPVGPSTTAGYFRLIVGNHNCVPSTLQEDVVAGGRPGQEDSIYHLSVDYAFDVLEELDYTPLPPGEVGMVIANTRIATTSITGTVSYSGPYWDERDPSAEFEEAWSGLLRAKSLLNTSTFTRDATVGGAHTYEERTLGPNASCLSPYRGAWLVTDGALNIVRAATLSEQKEYVSAYSMTHNTSLHVEGPGLNYTGVSLPASVHYADKITFGYGEYPIYCAIHLHDAHLYTSNDVYSPDGYRYHEVERRLQPLYWTTIDYSLSRKERSANSHFITQNFGNVAGIAFPVGNAEDTFGYESHIFGHTTVPVGPGVSATSTSLNTETRLSLYIFDSDPEYKISVYYQNDILTGKIGLLSETGVSSVAATLYGTPAILAEGGLSDWMTGTSSMTRSLGRDACEGRIYTLPKKMLDLALVSGGWWRSSKGYAKTILSTTKQDLAAKIETWFTTKYPDQDVRFLGLSIYKLST